jgi:ubiquitin carboxyl-terminal hydrolase 7
MTRVLMDNLDTKMKGTPVEGSIPKLFEGKILNFIKYAASEWFGGWFLR